MQTSGHSVPSHASSPALPHPLMSTQTDPTARPTIEQLVETELGETDIRTGGRNWLVHPPKDLYGLALSGGGIRSATFNLGLLQGLNRLGLLASFDYVSTVSGGGYLGGFWTRWRDVTGRAKSFPSGDVPPDCPEPREVRNLREFSNFLTPKLGVFSFDTGRMLVTAVSAMIPSLATVLALLVFVMMGWALVASQLFSTPAVSSLRAGFIPAPAVALLLTAVCMTALLTGPERWAGWVCVSGALLVLAETVLDFPPGYLLAGPAGLRSSTLVIVGITAVTILIFELFWRKRREDGPVWPVVLATLVALTVVGTAWQVLAGRWSPPGFAPYAPEMALPWLPLKTAVVWKLAYLLLPALAWGAGILTFVLLRTLTSRWMTSVSARRIRGAFDRVHSRLLFLVAAWTALAVIWSAGVLLHAWVEGGSEIGRTSGVVAAVGTLTGASTWIQRKLGLEPSRLNGGGMANRLKPLLPQLLSYSAIVLMLAGAAAICVELAGPGGPFRNGTLWLRLSLLEPLGLSMPVVLFLLAGSGAALGLFLFDPNEVGIHGFYRARLARAYCGASNQEGWRKTEEQAGDDVRLDRMASAARSPFHLICCAANDLGSGGIANLYRGARSAVLSPVGFSVGDEWAPWDRYRYVPTLSAAMTAAGAAFNSMMGWRSIQYGPGVTFLMAAFNLRLGLWLQHPRRAMAASRFRLLIGLPYYKELFSYARADGSDVHLSDGGHFENLAVYELIRRHCRVIVASDCGQDGERAFDDVGNLVRKVRQDFGVDIRIDLSPLRPGPDGLARQHMVAGDIHYPDGDTGVLLLFKPALVGSEPADLAQYGARNPAFPHQSTGDQFYDQAQWESYRRLGEHAALSALRWVVESVGKVQVLPGQDRARIQAAAIFSAARREWLAVPDGAAERLPRFTDGVAALDELLRQPGCATLLREVYPEIAALERANGRIWVPKLFGANPATATEGADRTAMPTGAAVVAAPDDPAATLHAVRRGLTFLYEVYRCEELERHHLHPVYLGVMNYAARWTSAPLVAFWWPLLKATFPLPFIRFLERRLGLAGCRDRAAKVVVPAGDGYARRAWEQERRGALSGKDITVLAYEKEMSYEGRTVLTAQLAVIRARQAGTSLVWDADDLYVPPGLWGIGIGGDFVRQLAEQAGELNVAALIVRVPAHPEACPTEKKTVADALQLYRSYGFRETCAAELPDGITGGPDVQWMILSLARTGEASTARKEMGEPVGA
jgi:GNAT superfamily N-acetyltransferase